MALARQIQFDIRANSLEIERNSNFTHIFTCGPRACAVIITIEDCWWTESQAACFAFWRSCIHIVASPIDKQFLKNHEQHVGLYNRGRTNAYNSFCWIQLTLLHWGMQGIWRARAQNQFHVQQSTGMIKREHMTKSYLNDCELYISWKLIDINVPQSLVMPSQSRAPMCGVAPWAHCCAAQTCLCVSLTSLLRHFNYNITPRF